MKKIVIATIKSWNIAKAEKFKSLYSEDKIHIVTAREELSYEFLKKVNPEYVFFPHWSWIIPEIIYNNFNCVVFHITDLPFGRGGSPLQNLLIRGIYQTKISAIKVNGGIDTGPVYFKELIDISEGNADEIFGRVSDIVFSYMIPKFLSSNVIPHDQTGDVVSFKRRKPDESLIPDGLSQRQLYDYIRMLDGEGYPKAFTVMGDYKVEYSDAMLVDEKVVARAEFKREV